jgi:hypothetical protein
MELNIRFINKDLLTEANQIRVLEDLKSRRKNYQISY